MTSIIEIGIDLYAKFFFLLLLLCWLGELKPKCQSGKNEWRESIVKWKSTAKISTEKKRICVLMIAFACCCRFQLLCKITTDWFLVCVLVFVATNKKKMFVLWLRGKPLRFIKWQRVQVKLTESCHANIQILYLISKCYR